MRHPPAPPYLHPVVTLTATLLLLLAALPALAAPPAPDGTAAPTQPATRAPAEPPVQPLPVAPSAPAPAPATPGTNAPSVAAAPADSGAPASGKALFGAYLLRHSRFDADSGAGSFTPLLPFDGRLIAGAMRAVAQHAFGQHQIVIEDPNALKLTPGRPIDLKDFEYEYHFLLDGSPEHGISTILVTRKLLPPPTDDAELLELLRQLEAM